MHGDNHTDQIDPAIIIANKMAESGNMTHAFDYIDSIYYSLYSHGPRDTYQVATFKSIRYAMRHDYKHALIFADSAVSVLAPLARKKVYNLDYAEATLLKGDALFELGLYDDAYKCYSQGKRVANSKQDVCRYHTYISHFDQRLAMISFRQANYGTAVEYYKLALSACQECSAKTLERSHARIFLT